MKSSTKVKRSSQRSKRCSFIGIDHSHSDESTFASSSFGFQSSEFELDIEDVAQCLADFQVDGFIRPVHSGSFSQSLKVRLCRGDDDQSILDDEEEIELYGYSSNRYVLKCPRNDLGQQDFAQQALNLKRESQVLSMLAHPNVIRLRGVCAEYSFDDPKKCFILYEALDLTVADMLKAWRKHPLLSRKMPLLRSKQNEDRQVIKASLHRRIQLIAVEICKVMSFIHSKGIVLRNLHSRNIGVDRKGQMKIFDFSEASPPGCIQKDESVSFVPTSKNVATSGLWELDDNTKTSDVGFGVDVYAFGVLLWEVASLREPSNKANPMGFSKANEKLRRQLIATKSTIPSTFVGGSPNFFDVPSRRLRDIIKACWDANPDALPSFSRLQMMMLDSYGPSTVYEYAHERRKHKKRSRLSASPSAGWNLNSQNGASSKRRSSFPTPNSASVAGDDSSCRTRSSVRSDIYN